MGPIWGRQDPGGPHVGSMNLAIWESTHRFYLRVSDLQISYRYLTTWQCTRVGPNNGWQGACPTGMASNTLLPWIQLVATQYFIDGLQAYRAQVAVYLYNNCVGWLVIVLVYVKMAATSGASLDIIHIHFKSAVSSLLQFPFSVNACVLTLLESVLPFLILPFAKSGNLLAIPGTIERVIWLLAWRRHVRGTHEMCTKFAHYNELSFNAVFGRPQQFTVCK